MAPSLLSGKRSHFVSVSMSDIKNDVDMMEVDFVVGPDQISIPAHETVLVRSSEVFARNWELAEDEGEKAMCTLNWNTEEAVKAFLKGMYWNKVDPKLDINILLELLGLCHTYMAKRLFKLCKKAIIKKALSTGNCLALVEMPGLYDVYRRLGNARLECFVRNLPFLLAGNENSPYLSVSANWSAEMWELVLNLEGPEVYLNEKTLFRELLRWRDLAPVSRQKPFEKLVRLVRFPLMPSAFIAQEVLPTEILSVEDIDDLLGYFFRIKDSVAFNDKDRNTCMANFLKFNM